MTPRQDVFRQPRGYGRIRLVKSFEELVTTRFENGINALCWQRALPGDFAEVVNGLPSEEGIASLPDTVLESLPLSAAGRTAVDILLQDQRLLRDLGLAPVLDRISAYPRDEGPGTFPTDVYSFHADSAPVEADTWLCTYHGSSSEGLRNDQAQRRVDLPEIRARLLREFGGEDDEGFGEYLRENCYDLHYAPRPHAEPFAFGIGNLWRIAVDYPESPVPACIHRAPEQLLGGPTRLLLIS